MSSAYLQVTINGTQSQIPMDAEPITIGRQIGNRLELDDTEASRFHCVIEKVASGFRVRDLGSRNGTRVNGQLVKTALLEAGDTVQVGRVEMRLVVSAAEAKPSPAVTSAARQQSMPEPLSIEPEEIEDGNSLNFLPESEYDSITNPNYANEAGAPDPGSSSIDASAPPTESLLQMAEALPEQTFNHFDIALINARGVLAHAAGAPKKRDEPVGEAITLLRLLLLVCFRTHASDIHIEPKNDIYLVRVRIDGGMVDAAKLKKDIGVKLCAVVKVLSDIDISQRNIVQEGHFTSRVPDRRVDYRVSFTPAMFGQKCVIRVLDAANAPRYLWDLGLTEWMFNDIDRVIRGDSGMVLVCGPTGSGKTASLYSILRSIDSGERNVITIEDPVEIQIEGITQIPVKEDQGNSFAALLRSVLRQDPDVILVGEIRDAETARTAIQAANTGHLVLSSVHSRDSVGTVTRLIDLGVEWYQIAAALQLVLAQRLVRQLCPHCRVGVKPSAEQAARLEAGVGQPVPRIFRSAGCPRCLHTGFAGRRAVFELLTVNEPIREILQRTPVPGDIYRALTETRFVKLLHSGYKLVADGITTMDEVERAVGF